MSGWDGTAYRNVTRNARDGNRETNVRNNRN